MRAKVSQCPVVALTDVLAAYCCTHLRVQSNTVRGSHAVVHSVCCCFCCCVVAVVVMYVVSQGWPARLRLHSSMMPRQQSMPSTPPPFHDPSSVPTRLAGHCDRSLPASSNSKFQQPALKNCRETHQISGKFEIELYFDIQQCLFHVCECVSSVPLTSQLSYQL